MMAAVTPPICPACRLELPQHLFGAVGFQPCPSCGAEIHVEIFPALFRPMERGRPAETALIEGTSTCFYHPERQASVPCDSCGRFLCALCDVELVPGEHLCANCIEAGRRKGRITALEQGRTRYDNIALLLALMPFTLVLWFMAFVSAPAAIFFAILSFKRPGSIVRPGRSNAILALVIATLTLAGIGVGIYFLIRAATSESFVISATTSNNL